MNDQPAQVPPRRKTRRLKISVTVLLAVIVAYFVYRQRLSHVIQRRIDSIHRAGFPATCAELDKWYPQPPAGENAADVYRNAFAHYQTWTNKPADLSVITDPTTKTNYFHPPKTMRDLLPIVGDAKLPPRTEPLPDEMQRLVAEYLSDNAEALRLLHQAASMKSCRFPVDLSKGVSTRLPHLNSARQAARLLNLEAIQYTEKQEPQQAVESVIALLGVSRSLNQEPVLISYLVHLACQGIAVESFQRILNRIPPTDAQLRTLATAIDESENPQALTRAFVGERCFWADIFQGFRTGKVPLKEIPSMWDGGESPPWIVGLLWLYRATGLLELDEKSYLDLMEQNVKATQLLPPESLAAAHAVTDKVEQLMTPIIRWRVLTLSLTPAVEHVVVKAGRSAAIIRDAQTAIAIERYRIANGALPKQLSDLVPTFLPAVPSDPFDGKLLRYKTLAKGFIVYSVGDDGKDNGGIEKNSRGVSYVEGTDITFTVER